MANILRKQNQMIGGFAASVGSGNPIGTIISFMGITAPDGYLACDGSIYNIADYQDLADFFTEQFGAVDYFGGNGTTTFAVPDLRGEFLRGTGTNSHTNQGSGSTVGVHQDATDNVNLGIVESGSYIIGPGNKSQHANTTLYAQNTDSFKETGKTLNVYAQLNDGVASFFDGFYYTARPTNTSILYCIKH